MKTLALIGLVLAMLVVGLPALATPSGVFSDDDGLPSEEHLEHLYEIGVVLGCGAGRSCASQMIPRAEAAAMVSRMMEIRTGAMPAAPSTVDTFVDDDGLWNGTAEPHIEGLVAAGVVNGCDSERRLFCPLRLMSRGEAIAVLLRAFEFALPTEAPNPFIDVEGVYYEDAVRAAAAAGVVDFSSGMFRGELAITRGEFAIWLTEAADLDVCRASPFTEGRQLALSAEFPRQRFTAFRVGFRNRLHILAESRQQATDRFGLQGHGDGGHTARIPIGGEGGQRTGTRLAADHDLGVRRSTRAASCGATSEA